MIFYKAFIYSRNSISCRVIFIYFIPGSVKSCVLPLHKKNSRSSNTGECQKMVTSFLVDSRITSMNQIHVSGHGSGDQIRRVVDGSEVKTLVRLHTEYEEYNKNGTQK